jgi:flagellar basal-body rod protein FlgG
MDLGLFIAASGMVSEQARQDQLSSNLSNVSTPGYKPSESNERNFGSLLLSNSQTGRTVGAISTGVASGRAFTNLTPSGAHETGQPLDFAVAGEGFFAVQTPRGVRYTRDGQFTVNAAGFLTDTIGNNVLSQGGAPIRVGAGRRVPAAAIGLYRVANPEKQGENLYTGGNAGRATGTIRTGALEESAVDPVKTMVEMMASMRTFQSGQQAIAAIGQTLQAAATQVGSVNPT